MDDLVHVWSTSTLRKHNTEKADTGTLKWNAALINIISYIGVFPVIACCKESPFSFFKVMDTHMLNSITIDVTDTSSFSCLTC